MIKITRKVRYSLLLVLFIGLWLISNCARKPGQEPVAIIADRPISADEFAFAYEMAPRSITSLPKQKARKVILDQLIERITLAREAERLHLDQDTLLEKTVDFYERLAINRELYLKHVRQPVKVTEKEERQVFELSRIKLYVRHFNTEQIDLAKQASLGILPFQHTALFSGVQQIELAEYGLIDQVSWRDIPQEIADILYHLPLKEFSEPYFDGNRYHVFQVVDIEKEVLLRENDFQANRESINGIIRRRKENKIAGDFVQQIMADQNVMIKAEALNLLTEEIWRDRPAETPTLEQFITNREVNTITDNSRDFLNNPIATFSSGRMTVADILINYKVNPIKISYQSKMAMRESMKNAVGMYVRDWVFSEKGRKERLDRKPSVIAEERTRREHLLMRKMLTHLGREFYEQYPDTADSQERLEKFIADYKTNLREAEKIDVDNDNLMAVKTTDEGLARKIDFVAFHTQ